MSSGEKTEAPTPRRREQARSQGSVPRSVELNSVLALLAGVLVFKFVGTSMLMQITGVMGNSFRGLSTEDWTISSVQVYAGALGTSYIAMMAPLFATLMVVGVVGSVVQSGPVLATKALSPDFSRINPLRGLRRILSRRSLVELVKSVAKLGIVGYVVFQAFQDKFLYLVTLSGSDISNAAAVISDVAMEILLKAGFALLALALLDYGYQRWEYEKNIRMTKHEVKEEMRQSEGDPKIRGKIRQQQRQIAARRMMQDVPKSDVIVTNPTHLAVALQYRPESMHAPRVVAKGQRLIAERIKDVARQHGVPVVENKPLAQALFKTVEVGSEIPPALYHAVAEILAFIYSLRRERRTEESSIVG